MLKVTCFQFTLFGCVTVFGGDIIFSFADLVLGWAVFLSLTSPSISDVTERRLSWLGPSRRWGPSLACLQGPHGGAPRPRARVDLRPPACPSPSCWVSAELTAYKATVLRQICVPLGSSLLENCLWKPQRIFTNTCVQEDEKHALFQELTFRGNFILQKLST